MRATRGTFLLVLATRHFLRIARVARRRFCNKSVGQCCKIFIEFNFLQHVANIGDGYLAIRATSFDFCRRTALKMSSCQC